MRFFEKKYPTFQITNKKNKLVITNIIMYINYTIFLK